MARTRGSRRNPVTGSPRKRVGSIALAKAKRDGRKETRTAQKKYDRSYRSRKLAKVKAQQARWYQKYGKKGVKAGTTRPTSKAVPKKKAVTKKKADQSPAKAAKVNRKLTRKIAKRGITITSASKNRIKTPRTKDYVKGIKKAAKKSKLSSPKKIQKARSEIKAAQRPKKDEAGYRANRKPVPRKGIGTKGIDVKVAHAVSKRHPDPKNLSQINKERRKAGLPALKTNAEIRMSLHRAIEGGKVKVFAKPTKSGVGLLKANLSGAAGGQSTLKRGTGRLRETAPGSGLLINAKKVRKEAYLTDESTYGEKLEALLRNRNLYAKNHRKEINIAQDRRKKAIFKQQTSAEATKATAAAKSLQRRLQKKISDPKTASASRHKAIQELHQVQSDSPTIIRKNTTKAADLAKKHGYTLKPAKEKTLDQVFLSGARISQQQHKKLVAELDARYKGKKQLVKGKLRGVDPKRTTQYDEQYRDLRRDLDHSAGIRKSTIRDSFKEDTPSLDQGIAISAKGETFFTGDIPDLILQKKGAIVDRRGKGAGGIKLDAAGRATNITRAVPPSKLKAPKRKTDRLNKTLQDRVNNPNFKVGRKISQRDTWKYAPNDIRRVKGADNKIIYVLRKGAKQRKSYNRRKLTSRTKP